MINRNTYIMYDFETGSRNPKTTQPIELAAIAINPRTLEIIPGSEFYSLIKPFDDEEAKAKGLDPLEDGALEVNKKTREILKTAPDIKAVWQNFIQYVSSFNYKGGRWDAPIPVGFNNNGFDDIIIERICCSAPWNLGPKDERGATLFHPVQNVDLMRLMFPWMESNTELKSLSMDNLREYFGMDNKNAHTADQDVKDQAEIFCRFMKMSRQFSGKVTFKDCFKLK